MTELAELEQELGGADCALEAVLAQIKRLGEILRNGSREQQKRAINPLFDSIVVRSTGEIEKVELQDWARPMYAGSLMVSCDMKCPLGTSDARHVATLAGFETNVEDLRHRSLERQNCS